MVNDYTHEHHDNKYKVVGVFLDTKKYSIQLIITYY